MNLTMHGYLTGVSPSLELDKTDSIPLCVYQILTSSCIASGFIILGDSNDKIYCAVKLLPQEVHT